LDVTPLSLGIETLGGVMTRLIERNTTIPARKSQIFSTATDNQTAVSIHVLQGERELASQNRTLGRFELTDIPPAPRGVPQIEVTFDIDANGIVHVSAKDLGTGKEQKIRIESSSGLSEADIEKMIKDAELHAEEDRKMKALIEARNESDSLIYSVEKMMREHEAKLDAGEKDRINSAISKLKTAMEGNNIEAIKQAKSELEQASHGFASRIYQDAANQQQTSEGSTKTSSESGEKVYDAEVVD